MDLPISVVKSRSYTRLANDFLAIRFKKYNIEYCNLKLFVDDKKRVFFNVDGNFTKSLELEETTFTIDNYEIKQTTIEKVNDYRALKICLNDTLKMIKDL